MNCGKTNSADRSLFVSATPGKVVGVYAVANEFVSTTGRVCLNCGKTNSADRNLFVSATPRKVAGVYAVANEFVSTTKNKMWPGESV